MTSPKLLILGLARSGKDTLCESLRDDYGYDYTTTSLLTAEIVMFPAMKTTHGYASAQECYEDRHNHRELWYKAIQEYNCNDKARLAKEVTKHSQIYAGMRDKAEVEECIKQGVFDYIVWVDKDGCFEDENSCTVDESLADYVVTNNRSLEELKKVGAGFVNHLVEQDKHKTGFRCTSMIDYVSFLDSDFWNEGVPSKVGTYNCLCHDIVNSWVRKLVWNGNTWVGWERAVEFPALVDKWREYEH